MKRLTTNNCKTDLQTLLNYAYAKDGTVYLAFGADEDNIPLEEYIAIEARRRGCSITTTEVIEGCCMECDCPMAILYVVSIQAAQLRARLKEIEDILGDSYNLGTLQSLVSGEGYDG